MMVGALPEPVAALVGTAELVPVSIGRSDASTARILRPDGDWFLKLQAVDDLGTSLVGEAERMGWLGSFVEVPEVVEAGSDGTHEWLVASALSGSDATRPEHHVDLERLVREFGQALSRFHDVVPLEGCPFDSSTSAAIEHAGARVAAGRIDETDFGPLYRGMSAAELYDLMMASVVPVDDDLVVLHGDYCVPNVVVHQGTVHGYLDVGRAGVGDRHRDLAVACRSVAYNFGGHAVGLFLDSYGIERPDLARLDFFVMLDEFF